MLAIAGFLGVDVTGPRECGVHSRDALLPVLPSVSDPAKSSFSSRSIVFALDATQQVACFRPATRKSEDLLQLYGPIRAACAASASPKRC